MMKLVLDGQTYEARNRDEMIVKLREARLTYAEIADLVKVTRARIGQVLKEKGLNGHLVYPELDNPNFFSIPDEVLALQLKVPVSKISAARKRLGVKRSYSIKLHDRRKHLSKVLFGDRYLPGPKFVDFIKAKLQLLSPRRRELIEDFYIIGITQSLADHINVDGNRTYRSAAKRELRDLLFDFNPEELVKEKVLIHAKSNPKSN